MSHLTFSPHVLTSIRVRFFVLLIHHQVCGFCKGSGQVESFATDSTLGTMEMCLNCEGQGYTTCTTCNGTGIQPRYLDRREFQDDD